MRSPLPITINSLIYALAQMMDEGERARQPDEPTGQQQHAGRSRGQHLGVPPQFGRLDPGLSLLRWGGNACRVLSRR